MFLEISAFIYFTKKTLSAMGCLYHSHAVVSDASVAHLLNIG